MQCCNCDNEAVHMHHVVPKSKGGTDRDSNLVSVCGDCHALVHGIRATCNGELIKAGLAKRRAKGLPCGKPPKWRKSQLEEGAKLFKGGQTLYEASAACGVPKSTLYRYVVSGGPSCDKFNLSERLAAAYKAYSEGSTLKEACRLNNVAARTFRKYRDLS